MNFSKQLNHAASAFIIILLSCSCESKSDFLGQQTKENISIVIMGNTFAERLQNYNFFEVFLHKNFEDKQLTVRNIGWSGDEIHFQSRPLNFPDQMKVLRDLKADVIIACYGMNESFNGADSLQIFERRLSSFLDSLQSNQFNGTSAPEILLVSPIAHEKITGSKADSESHNEAIRLYTESMEIIVKEKNVSFVNLYEPTRKWYSDERQLTINGIHLNKEGYQLVSEYLALKLDFRISNWKTGFENSKKLVDLKNKQYYYHYRAVNSEYIRGRRKEPWVQPSGGPISFPKELSKLENMVMSLDSLVWAYQRTEDKGYIDAAREILNDTVQYLPINKERFEKPSADQFVLPEGFEINLFASEIDFSIANPVKITFDPQGRLWVASMPSYPQYLPGAQPNDKIVILEDLDNDGVADTELVYADSLYMPTSFELGKNGVYVSQPPNILFMKDTDGDGKADEKEIIMHGFGTEDVHHTLTTFTWGPDGALYWHTGTFLHSQVETPYGVRRSDYGATWRYEPETHKLEPYISYPYANAWGHIFLRDGTQIVSDVSTGMNYFAPPLTVASEYPRKLLRMKDFLTSKQKPKVCGIEVVSSRHFPDENQGNMLFNTFVRSQGVNQHQIQKDSSGIIGMEVEPLLKSLNPNFRPVDLQFGPDGALYVVDWYNPIINHGERALRDTLRDHTHGRIWRITYRNKPLLQPVDLTVLSTFSLLDQLKADEDRVRYRVRTLLRQKEKDEVLPVLDRWLLSLDSKDALYDQHRLEALWVFQQFNQPNLDLLEDLLASEQVHIRAAGVRVLFYWKDYIRDPEERLIKILQDESMNVRLQAIVSLSHFKTERSVKVLLEVSTMPTDYYIRYALNESFKNLKPVWWNMFKKDKNFLIDDPEQVAMLFGLFSNAEKLEVPAFIKNGPDWPKYAWPVLSTENLGELAGNFAVERFIRDAQTSISTDDDGKSLLDIGSSLITGSGCYTCHRDKGELVGPSFDEISKKYNTDDIPFLARKIIEGGVGVWGDTPMSPHPMIGKKDSETMVNFILSR